MAESQEKVTPEAPTQEEIQAEEEALKETSEDTVRQSIVEDTGLDSETDKEAVDKLVTKEVKAKKELSTAIKQKRTWRTKAQETPQIEEKKEEEKKDEPVPGTVSAEELGKMMDDRLEKRELSNLDVSDTLKKEVESYAQVKGVSVKEAMQSDYIKFIRRQEEDADNTEGASLDGGGGKVTTKSPGIDPKTIDRSTDEGKAAFKKWEDNVAKELG